MFDKRPKNAFAIQVVDKDSTVSCFQGHLGAIDGHTFLDVFSDGSLSHEFDGWYVPAHVVHRVWYESVDVLVRKR